MERAKSGLAAAVALVIGICVWPVQVGAQHGMSAESMFKRGTAFLKEGSYDKAIADYNHVIKLSPDNALAYANRGFAHLKKKDYGKAISDLSKAVQLDPKMADAYYDRGLAYIQKRPRDYAKAVSDFEAVLRLAPGHPNVKQHLQYARQSLNRQELPAGASDTAAGVAAAGRHAASSVTIALIQQGELDKAIEEANKKIEENPTDTAFLSRGLVHTVQDNFEQAIEDLNKAIELNPNNSDAFLLLGSALAINGSEADKVISELNEAIRLNPGSVEALFLRGAAYSEKEEYDKAIADFEAALKIDPRHTDARHGLVEAQILNRR